MDYSPRGRDHRLVVSFGRVHTRLSCDRGEVPTFFIIFLTAMVALFGAIHVALVVKGRSVVSAAAQDGLYAAQVFGGTVDTGRAAAEQTLNLDRGLTNETVEVSISTVDGRCDQVRVRVSARVETPVIELFNIVQSDVVGPCERFYSEPDRR